MALHLHLLIFFLLCLFNETHSRKTEEECETEIKKFDELKNEVSDKEFLQFFKDCVADFYDFESTEDNTMWKKTPGLDNYLYSDHFTATAKAIEKFFKKTKEDNKKENRDWENIREAMKKVPSGSGDNQCPNMLLVVAARQVYVTYLLREAAFKAFKDKANEKSRFSLCAENEEKTKLIIPKNACYPRNPGSTRCTSDYDVSLVGPNAGKVVKFYNKYFEQFNTEKDVEKMTSEDLLDNNIYAYSLEQALPELIKTTGYKAKSDKANSDKENSDKANSDKTNNNEANYATFLNKIKENYQKIPSYQSQNIVLAYMKVHMFDSEEEKYYEEQTSKCLEREVYGVGIKSWIKKFADIKEKDLKGMESYTKMINYETFINGAKDPWDNSYVARLNMAIAGFYASESYFSKGAIRVVVGSQQMKNELITNGLTVVDHWSSFIENFGDVLKEHERSCKGDTDIYKCLLKLSKYLNRTFKSIEVLLKPKISNKIKNQQEINLKDHRDKKGNKDCPTVKEEEAAITRFTQTKIPSAVEITTSWITCFKDKGKKEIAAKYNIDDCSEGEMGNERKDWAKYFLSTVLACSDDQLNANSAYKEPPPPKPNEKEAFKNLGKNDKQTKKEPAKVLYTRNCISKLQFLIRGVNRRMLSYANTDKINLGLPIAEMKE